MVVSATSTRSTMRRPGSAQESEGSDVLMQSERRTAPRPSISGQIHGSQTELVPHVAADSIEIVQDEEPLSSGCAFDGAIHDLAGPALPRGGRWACVLAGVQELHRHSTRRCPDHISLCRESRVGPGVRLQPRRNVLGTTTPLLTLILGAAGRVFGVAAIPTAAAIGMIAASVGTAVIIAMLIVRAGKHQLWPCSGRQSSAFIRPLSG